MQKKICQWCGKTFYIKGRKDSHREHCCSRCASYNAKDRCQYKRAIDDPTEALAYIKKMLRRIKRHRCCLWETLSMPQWDRLIMLYDPRVKAEGELGQAIRVIGELLSMPAMQPLAEEDPLWDDIEWIARTKPRRHYEKHVRS